MKNKRMTVILVIMGILLLIPLIAMQFTTEVQWDVSDFVVMGGLLLATGFLCDLVMRKTRKVRMRIFLCLIIILVFMLLWAEMAVGIFGSPIAGS